MQLVDSEGTPPPDCVDHLELNNPTPLVSCTSEDGDGSERIEVADLPEGTYALRVWASDDGFTPDVGQYHLNIDIAREPCDRETPALDHDQHDQGRGNNTRLLAEVLPDGLYPGLTLCRFDEDWYRVDVPPRRDLRALLTFEAGDGDLDLSLHDGDGEVLEGCGEGGGQPCAASGEAAADLTYQRDDGGLDQPVFLRVHGGDVLDPNGYALTMEFIEVDGGS